MQCFKYDIFGAVQGVGFRPFVYKIATSLNLFGEVYNDSSGVKIFVVGRVKNIDEFENLLKTKLPPLAKIQKITKKQIKLNKIYTNFTITKSKEGRNFSPILPDIAICDECVKEFYDKNNQRFEYPLINCTNCGPRISIIKKIPYDRKNTTMDEFKMCEFCQSEYEDPTNIRYHAEPISCPKCSLKIFLKDKNKNILSLNNDAIKQAAKLLENGKILAIKGLSGFHLVCDSFNEEAVKELRIRKNRPSKPFAIMCKDEKMAQNFAKINPKESEILNQNIKPIVILEKKKNLKLAFSVVQNLNKIAIFLPNTALHLLLFKYFSNPIIATSANISNEPIIYDEKNLLSKLSNVIDYYIDHERKILVSSDDSIFFLADEKHMCIRSSRGLNPEIFLSNFKQKGCFLALGAELKNQFVIYHDGLFIISPYIGDLKNIATYERFKSLIKKFQDNYNLSFKAIIADLHPHFLHTKEFEKSYITHKIQHHHAHLISALYENNLLSKNKKFLGFCFDGTGLGEDNSIWGGEVFLFDEYAYERIYHFDDFLLLGGSSSIKNINQLAFSIMKKYNINEKSFFDRFDKMYLKNLELIYQKKLNSVKTSSLGRIIDAFYALNFNKTTIDFDAQAGMMIESKYDENIKDTYEFNLNKNVIEYKNAFLNSPKDDLNVACSKFINSICAIMIQIAKKHNLEVVLSGGVFQNSTLLKLLIKEFKTNNIKFYLNQKYPTNDGGIAIGQMIWFLSQQKKE